MAGLERASDAALWEYARAHDLVIVSKDADYYDMSLLRGAPPRVIWIRIGNATKATIARLLLDYRGQIAHALTVEGKACVEIY